MFFFDGTLESLLVFSSNEAVLFLVDMEIVRNLKICLASGYGMAFWGKNWERNVVLKGRSVTIDIGICGRRSR